MERDLDALLARVATDCGIIGSESNAPIERRLQKCLEIYPSGFGIWNGRSICVNASIDAWYKMMEIETSVKALNEATERGETPEILVFAIIQDSPRRYRCVTKRHRKWEFKTVDDINELPTEFVVIDEGVAKTIVGPGSYPEK
jgi:hypothetical protein